MSIIYDIFLKELLESDVNMTSDNFKAMLLNDLYKPDKQHKFEDISPFEIKSKNYSPLGKDIVFEVNGDNSALIEVKNGEVSWNNLTAEIKYVIVYKNTDAEKIPIICEDFGEVKYLQEDNLKLSWNDFFLQLGQFKPKEPDKPIEEGILGTLGLGVLGTMILGKGNIK